MRIPLNNDVDRLTCGRYLKTLFNPGEKNSRFRKHYFFTRLKGYKTFFMLKSAEHEILNAH